MAKLIIMKTTLHDNPWTLFMIAHGL